MTYEARYKRFQTPVPDLENISLPSINTIGSIACRVEPAYSDTLCETIAERFNKEPDSFAIPVIDMETGCAVGLINRHEFNTLFAARFGRSLYHRKPCSEVMDQQALQVDVHETVDSVEHIISTHNPEALASGFIITDNCLYKGICSAILLLRLSIQRTRMQNQQLEDARKQAEQANASKSLFLANMSHELRTPLNAIIGFSEIMNEQMFGPLGNPTYHEYSADILKSGQHLLSIVNDVLDMSKIEQGMFDLNIETVDINAMILDIVHFFRTTAEKSEIRLETRSKVSRPEFKADNRAIRQILINLVSNAIKFTPTGGWVRITVHINSKKELVLTVKDNGTGIADKDMSRVMEPFTQAENAMNKSHQGTGLGLTLVKALATLHGGDVKLKSSVGKGTEVSVSFPQARQKPMHSFAEQPG